MSESVFAGTCGAEPKGRQLNVFVSVCTGAADLERSCCME